MPDGSTLPRAPLVELALHCT